MNYTELNDKLYKLNKSELSNKNNIYESIKNYHGCINYYDFLPTMEGQEYFISKHNRFKPVEPHIHSTCEISYIYNGECTEYINNEKIVLKEGDLVILDRKVPHSIEATDINDIMLNFQMKQNFFDTSFLQQLWGNSPIGNIIASLITNKNENSFLIFHTKDNPMIQQTIKNILCEHYDYKIGSQQIINSYMMILFTQLLRSSKYYSHLEVKNKLNNVLLADLLGYIEKNYVEGNLNNVAKHFCFSTTHISRLLKNSTGKTFKELVHEQRLNQAKYLLCSTEMPIYQISEQIGYTNLNYFYEKFKEHYKIHPQKYRTKHKL